MQQAPGQLPPKPDAGAVALHSISDLGQVGTIATAQLIGGLSGLLVSEGLARVVRDILGVPALSAGAGAGGPAAAPAGAQPGTAEEGAPPSGDGEALAGLSAKALKEAVAQGVAGRIIALNSLNTYLSLAAAEQLRRIGTQLATGEGLPGTAPAAPRPPAPQPAAPQAPAPQPAQAPPAYPYPGPVYWSQVPPAPYRWR